MTVLIDAETVVSGAHSGTVFDVSGGAFDLPVETIRRWMCIGSITPVIVAADGQRLYLSRTVRLANRAQRRVLQALYRTCALCDTPFENCQIHHLHPYESGGPTDIDNLLPLCKSHHGLAHEGGWRLHLAGDRTLTVVQRDGTVLINGPPTIRAA